MTALARQVTVTTFRNHYHCEECDESWSDVWCCASNDQCPSCGREIEPEDSDEVSVDILGAGDVCDVCHSTHPV